MTSANRTTASFRPGRYALFLFGVVAMALAVGVPACSSSNTGANTEALLSCSLNSDCSNGLICALGKCRSACMNSGDCGMGGSCVTDSMMHAVCQPAVDKNKLCNTPSDCPSPLACASDYRCRNLCSSDANCNVYGITGRVCATDANGVNYCADPNEVMNGQLTIAPPSGHSDAGVVEPDATMSSSGTSSSSGSSSGVGTSSSGSSGADGSSGASSSGGTSSGASGGDSGPDAAPVVCMPACGPGHQCVAGACVMCGVASAPCCGGDAGLGGTCGTNLSCNAAGICECGGANEECCSATTCNTGLTCDTTMNKCVCGAAGQSCCPAAGGSGPSTCTGALQCASISCTCEIACSGSMVQRSDGSLWENSTTPVTNAAAALFIATDFSSYYYTSGSSGLACAVKSDGTVWCWGSNGSGQLGSPNAGTSSAIPVQVYTNSAGSTPLTGITKVFVDGYDAYAACAINGSGQVWCWGYGSYGILGNGYKNNSNFAVPVLTASGGAQFSGVDQMSVAYDHICAHKTDGTIYCWGDNTYGQIGQGTSSSTNPTYLFPAAVQALMNYGVRVSVGVNDSCASTSDGTAWCWGYNGYGLIGNGLHSGNALVPSQVLGGGDGGAPLGNISWIEIGNYSTPAACVVISTDNSLWCWGYSSIYEPTPYTEGGYPVSSVFKLCPNGSTNPTYIDGKGALHYGGSKATQITCP